ncbi:hypothetical protein JCM10450v2_000054 [Rhodotorula kratochvilovae]
MGHEAHLEYVDGVPGSLHLVNESIHHSDGVHSTGAASDDIILAPQPTMDVNDPYNWSDWRKHRTLFATVTYIFTCGFCCSTVFSGFAQIQQERNISYNTLTQGTGYLYGFYGWGGLFIMPLALRFGHRPIYFFTLLVIFAMSLWTTWVETPGEWIASRIIYGTFGSPCESMNEVSIAMIYFGHERGFYLGFYSIALYAGAFLAPVCSGYLFDAGGLEAVMYFTSGIAAVGCLIIFFMFEEVCYNRKPEFERANRFASIDTKQHGSRSDSPDKSDGVESKFDVVAADSAEPLRLGQERNLVGTPHSYLYSLGMFRETYCSWRQVLDAVWRPLWLMVRFPCIFYAGFSLGTVLNAPPYNFGSGTTGLVYIGPLIIACFAGPITGIVGDRLVIRSARKNGGVREPEARLWINIFNAAIVPPAFVLWGVGAVKGIHWFGLEMALIWIGAFVVVQAAVSCAYILDCYKELALEVMVAAVIVRNTMAFAIGYAVAPWLEGMGIQNTYLTMGFAGLGFILSFLIIIWRGKHFRRESKEIYWKMVATAASTH